MAAVFDKPSLWQRIQPIFTGYDGPLMFAMVVLGAAGLLTMYSAGFDAGTRFVDHGRNMLLALAVVFIFAGLSWKLIIPVLVIGAIAITAVVVSEDAICEPDVKWPLLRDYQKNRVCTLLDPTTDPLGKGFHIIQGMIAIGSGGVQGKGFMKGTQTHLEFIPERTTDFIFAAFSEEFGLVGGLALLLGFTFLIFRGLMIAA